jgi:hypothetical protein
MQLARPFDMLLNLFIQRRKPTSAEEAKILRERPFFPYRKFQPSITALFSVCVAYGLLVPLILPIGLLFMVLRHCTDYYNIRNVFAPGDPNTFSDSLHSYRQSIRLMCRQFSSAGAILAAYMFLFFLSAGAFEQAAFSAVVLGILAVYIAGAFSGFRWLKWLSCEPPGEVVPESLADTDEMRVAYICPLVLDMKPYQHDADLRKTLVDSREKFRDVPVPDSVRKGNMLVRPAPEETPVESRESTALASSCRTLPHRGHFGGALFVRGFRNADNNV